MDGSVIRSSIPSSNDSSSSSSSSSSWTIERVLSEAGISLNELNKNSTMLRIDNPGQSNNKSPLLNVSSTMTISQANLKQGSMISILSIPSTNHTKQQQQQQKQKQNQLSSFIPFPHLAKAKSYATLLRRQRQTTKSHGSSSYTNMAKLRSAMHVLEPSSSMDAPIQRLYICRQSAEQFQSRGVSTIQVRTTTTKSKSSKNKNKKKTEKKASITTRVEYKCQVGLLLGTITSERRDIQKRELVRTSLSTPIHEREMVNVARVQCLWIPPPQPQTTTKSKPTKKKKKQETGIYDATSMIQFHENQHFHRVLTVAHLLGLRPIGWIFSYNDDRTNHHHHQHTSDNETTETSNNNNNNDHGPPMLGRDILIAAKTQIQCMKYLGRDVGNQFLTVAMNARTGETEAFQLNDVVVQMVSEELLSEHVNDVNATTTTKGGTINKKKKKKNKSEAEQQQQQKELQLQEEQQQRILSSSDPVLIDAEETHDIDSVLCLINTAVLSHVGLYCGPTTTKSKQKNVDVLKSNGLELTNTMKKKLLTAITTTTTQESSKKEKMMMSSLCHFDVLMGLDSILGPKRVMELCEIIRKYARGQRKSLDMKKELIMALTLALGG